MPGYLDATAFRFVFIGETAALRSFLNKLASFELPVLVREVEVEPATATETAEVPAADEPAGGATPAPSVVLVAKPTGLKATPAPKSDGAAPIVSKPWCRFTVTVEYIELVAAGAADAAADGGKSST